MLWPGYYFLTGVASAFPSDGVIVIGGAAVVQAIWDANPVPPLVGIGAMDETVPNVDTVTVDLMPGAVEAVTHLVDQGRRRIAFLRTGHVLDQMGKGAPAYRPVI